MQPAPKIPNGPPVPAEARCVRLPAKAENVADIAPVVERRTLMRALNELLIEVKAAAVKWIDFYYMGKLTDEAAAVADAKAKSESGAPVGSPELPIFDKATQDQRLSWIADYVNVPLEQMSPYTDNLFDQALIAEPKNSTQEIYALLDPVIQTVLTDQNADIPALLEQAEADAQALIEKQ